MENDLRAIRRTLEMLEIKSTFDNLNKLLGCMQLIDEMIARAEREKEAQNVSL